MHGFPSRVGRTVRAVVLTLVDLSITETLTPESRVVRIGGLRSGRAVIRGRRQRIERYSYVPGVEVSAPMAALEPKSLRVRVTGRAAARGTLRFDFARNRIRGHLGGHRVGLRLTRQTNSAIRQLYAPERAAASRHRRGLTRLPTAVP